MLDALAEHYGHDNFRVLLSTPMESNRPWALEWEGLDVVVQKTLTLKGRWKHPRGFSETTDVHFPLDTVSQLRKFFPDIIISTEMGLRSVLALASAKLRRSSLILWTEVNELTEHGRGRTRGIIRKILARHAQGFLALGTGGVDYMAGLGAPPEKIFKLLYTTDVRRFAAESGKRENPIRLLYVGQLIERKGLLQFASALGEWAERHPEQKVALTFAGDGPLREKLQMNSGPPNLAVEFLGNLSYAHLPSVYAKAGVLVFPTLADTWGVVVNEAMAAGLPVLGSVYSQAVQELVIHGRNGWTFRPDKPEEMYGVIHECLTTPLETLDRMRDSARKTALELTPARVAGIIQGAVTSCLDKSRREGLSRHKSAWLGSDE
ncbi:MAG TPA: glycosyltransferase family 4 protein [Bryobacteraceae bacterium]|nr:glycosyltransferase family 4 protein [Bryobacteraceae bacterium]